VDVMVLDVVVDVVYCVCSNHHCQASDIRFNIASSFIFTLYVPKMMLPGVYNHRPLPSPSNFLHSRKQSSFSGDVVLAPPAAPPHAPRGTDDRRRSVPDNRDVTFCICLY